MTDDGDEGAAALPLQPPAPARRVLPRANTLPLADDDALAGSQASVADLSQGHYGMARDAATAMAAMAMEVGASPPPSRSLQRRLSRVLLAEDDADAQQQHQQQVPLPSTTNDK